MSAPVNARPLPDEVVVGDGVEVPTCVGDEGTVPTGVEVVPPPPEGEVGGFPGGVTCVVGGGVVWVVGGGVVWVGGGLLGTVGL